MSNTSYTIRNYQQADFDRYVRLNIEAEKLEPMERFVSPQFIAESLGRPNYSPEQNLFLVETAGDIVGYMDVTPELTIGRLILDCWIHPQHRRKGLATKLLGYAIKRAQELGVKVAHVNIPPNNLVAQSVLSKLGFEFVRRYLEMNLDIDKVLWLDVDGGALRCCHMQCGEEDKLTMVQNNSFAGHWGFNPNTVEEIIYRINLSNCSPEDVILAYDGDKLVGYCWVRINREGEDAGGKRKGRFSMLGVDPNCRRGGVGRRLLLAGLAYLKSKGLQVVELTVDSENEAAYAMHRSVGFQVRTSSLWYEKVID